MDSGSKDRRGGSFERVRERSIGKCRGTNGGMYRSMNGLKVEERAGC